MIEGDDSKPNAWLLDPVASCLSFLVNEITFLGAAERSFSAIGLVPALLSLTKHLVRDDLVEKLDTLSEMTIAAAQLAQQQLDEGMRSARSNACVAFWSAIETTIEETLMNHLLKIPQSMELVKRDHPSVREAAVLDMDSARSFVRAWEARLQEPNVVERAIQMLAVFDLDFSLEQKHKQNLTELCALRNVAVHCRGIVDDRFKKKVPWCEVKVGDVYKLDREAVIKFYDACAAFCIALMSRTTESRWIVTR